MAKQKKISVDATITSAILKKIRSEMMLAAKETPGGDRQTDYYAKNGNGGYAKTGPDGIDFGKSDPPKRIETVINVSNKARALKDLAKVTSKIKAIQKKSSIR